MTSFPPPNNQWIYAGSRPFKDEETGWETEFKLKAHSQWDRAGLNTRPASALTHCARVHPVIYNANVFLTLILTF